MRIDIKYDVLLRISHTYYLILISTT